MRAYMRRGRGWVAVNLHRLRLVQHLKLNLVPHKMADHRHFYTRCPQQGTARSALVSHESGRTASRITDPYVG